MKQRGAVSRPSRFIAFRATEEDQSNLRAILEAGIADNLSDAIRVALVIAAKYARRFLKKGDK